MHKSKDKMSTNKNTPQMRKRGKSKERQTANSSKSKVETVPNNNQIKSGDQPSIGDHDKNVIQKSKATYSAQYQAPHISQQQNFKAPSNLPNTAATGHTCCNGIPLYNTSTRMLYNGPNISRENGPGNNMQYSCPCSRLPPPMPPCENDLWDLQFCRWWGWNWIRKREEMLNQKKAEGKTEGKTEGKSEGKPKGITSASQADQPKKKSRKPGKQDDFFSWCNKLFKGGNKKTQELKGVEKQQLQELYDTPCSSVTCNKCPCPLDDWECLSLDLKGEYECYCDTTRQTSRSTVIINKTRHQRCKQNMRKHQSWVFEKTESSSSDDVCPHICLYPQRNESSTEDSIEYLSMRMAQVKSDDEDNQECCPCCNKQKEIKKDACCQCKMQKKGETKKCCPCMIKVVYKEPNNCNSSNNSPKENCCCKIVKQKNADCTCNTYPKQNCCCSIVKQKNADCTCNRYPVLVSRTVPPCKVPQLRKYPLNDSECKKRPKRKYIECNCHRKKPCLVDCLCEQPRKKIKILSRPREVDCYYCCCCCCCCCCNKKDQPEDNKKVLKSKSENSLKQTADKCTGSKSMVNNLNVMNYGMYGQTKDANVYTSFPIGDGMPDKFYHTGQFSVSKAFQEGLFSSPVTGRLYSLNPETFTVNHILPQNNLPEPIDVNEKIFNINPIESPIADEEHKVLLSAVCEAIMSSRFSKNERLGQTSTECSANNNWRSNRNTHRPSIFKRPRSYRRAVPQRNYDYFDFISDRGQPSTATTELEELSHKNFTLSFQNGSKVSKAYDYKRLVSSNNIKLPLPTKGATENFKYVKSLSRGRSLNNMSEKSRYFITNGKHGPVRRRICTPNSAEAENYKTQQFYNLNMVDSEQSQLQSREGFSPANIFGNYNQGAFLDPTRQKSFTDNSMGGSGDSVDSDEASLSVKKQEDEKNLFIPFNSPRNWINPPKVPGISMTGLFSTVTDLKGFPKNSPRHDHKISKTNRYNKTGCLKNQRLYNSLFANENPECSQDFSNRPYNNYSPIPNPGSAARNPTIYPSLVLQELPTDVAQGTQTNTTKISAASSKKRVQEMGVGSNYINEHQEQTLKEVRSRKSHGSGKLAESTNSFNSKALQTSNSKATETLYISTSKAPRINISKAAGNNNNRLIQTPAPRNSTASNTIYSIGNVSTPKFILPNGKSETNREKINQTSFSVNPHQFDNTQTKTNTPTLHLANNAKSIVINTVALSNPPQNSSHTTGISIGQFKSPRTSRSATVDTISLNSKSVEMGNTKLTSNSKQMKRDSISSNLFTKECNSEKEIGCKYYNEQSSKNLQTTYTESPFSNENSSSLETVIHNERGFVFHEQDLSSTNLFVNSEVKLDQSEKLLTLVDGVSEENEINLPLAQQNMQATTSKDVDRVSSIIEDKPELPKTFKSAIPTPVYMTSATSPFKIKYAKTRLNDRAQSGNYVTEKVLIRESPFSMFCNPVPSKSFDITPSQKSELKEKGSMSRPDRQMVVNTKTKKLKMRDKRWRY